MRRFASSLLVAVATVLLAAGCKVDIAVGVDARADGSGSVRVEVAVDQDVTDRVDLATQLDVDDLRKGGWVVTEPAKRSDGLTAVVATKPFQDPDGARLAMEEISGPTGPFRDFRVVRSAGFLTTTTRFTGTVDFTRGAEALGDPEVGRRLGGSDLGIDTAAVERALNGPIDRAVQITVSARLPGTVEANAPTVAGNGAVWRPKLRDTAVLTATSTAWNTTTLLALGGGLAIALLAAALLLRRRSSRRASRRRTPRP